jgi:hypothetical protein
MMLVSLCNFYQVHKTSIVGLGKIFKQKSHNPPFLHHKISTNKPNMSDNISTKGSTMKAEFYNKAATPQMAAHDFAQPALNDCITRILDSHPNISNECTRALRISDLGSAGGTAAINLLRCIEALLQQHNETRPIEYFFNDLPTSDFNVLVKTIHDSKLSHQFFPMCI